MGKYMKTHILGKLSTEVVQIILEELTKTNNAVPLDKTKQRWLISWHTLEEWADIIYNWAQTNGFIGSVCTLYELAHGENTIEEGMDIFFVIPKILPSFTNIFYDFSNSEFYGLDNEVLIRSLKVLEMSKKAEMILFDGNEGVKFF